jgi:manganese/zinc/iron transport system permease protein
MNNAQIEIQIIAALVAAACALPGTFLVLRKMALITDAISHAILPGIVLGFFITQDLNAPLLIVMATLTGVLTVFLVSYTQKTGLVKEDTAIGLIFPVLFSIGVIMIALRANDVHLDVDAVLLGEIAFAPFDRLVWSGVDVGPKSMWVVGIVLVISILLLNFFFKELKLSTFDAGLSASLGFSPVLLHYGLMTLTSVTTVVSFEAVGAILVVALMIAPAATAYLLTKDLRKMLFLSVFFGVLSAIAGYWLAHFLDASIAGSITTILGFLFLSVYLFSPKKGWIAVWYQQRQQKLEVSLITFLLHIHNHDLASERHIRHLREHINWQDVTANAVLKLAQKNNFISIDNGLVSLTDKGLTFTEQAITYILDNHTDGIESMKQKFFLFRG